ncbi:ATP-binding cassette domain-containing protein [Comamonadaceae bacterium M7527]|nr:ATP-binding cassette domain-containing protein [Comamonadaceae bacterium M7527]
MLFDWQQVSASMGGLRQVKALRNISLQVHAGERIAIIGPNGSGKSTLLRALHGLQATQGQAWRAPSLCEKGAMAMLFQRPYAMRMSTLNNIRVALWLQSVPWAHTKSLAMQGLHKMGLQAVAEQNGRTLSGGQLQRMALARAWVLRPRLWLLDEPTASLDPHAKRDVEALIATFAQSDDSTLIFSSHNLGQVKRLAQRVWYLQQGSLLADMPVAQFFNESHLEAQCPEALAFIKGEI